MYPVLFKIGPIAIYTYGVMAALGILTALFISIKRAEKKGVAQNVILDLFLCIVIAGFIGARTVYVFLEWDYFLRHPARIVFANEGFVFYGGFIAAFIACFLYAIKNKLKPQKMADIIAPGVVIAHAIGRIGCFFYGCCYGKPTHGIIGVIFPQNSPAGALGVRVIPTQLICFFALLIIFFLLLAAEKTRRFEGEIFLLYVILYAVSRFIIEFFRGDPRGNIWMFSVSQFIAIIMAAVASILFFILNKKKKGNAA